MGGFTAYRNHLLNLFSNAFARHIPKETAFCLVIIDVMQFLAGKVKFSTDDAFYPHSAAHTVKEVIEKYTQGDEYRVTKGIIALLDTTKNVPTNKARTQQKRGVTEKVAILDESLFDRVAKERGDVGDALNWITQEPWRWPLDGDTIWRSNNLKFHLYRAVTEALLGMTLPEGVKLVIDDGAFVSDQVYRESAKKMISDYGFEEASAYAKECLVSSLARHHFTQRFTLKCGQKEPERLDSTHVGEADVKIPRFIVHGSNGTSSYLVVSQDTDIIFVLLLHLKTILANKSRKEVDPNFSLWLDTQTPQDKKMGVSRLYRFIDVKCLYYDILDLFALEYPEIKQPIETLVFLVYSLETDFTLPFDGALKVGVKTLWNTFSELHTPLKRLRSHGYLMFNDFLHDELAKGVISEKDRAKQSAQRAKERSPTLPTECFGMLNTALTYTYCEALDTYDIIFDTVACQRFFYLLCQFRVCQDLVGLGYSAFDKKQKTTKGAPRKCILTVDELFAWTAEIESRLTAHKENIVTESEGLKRKAIEVLVKPDEKKLKTSLFTTIRLPQKRLALNIDAIVEECMTRTSATATTVINLEEDEIEEEEEIEEKKTGKKQLSLPGATNQATKKKLEELVRNAPPKDYGIPRAESMLARIYRIGWLMNYHQNGWKCADYATNFAEPATLDTSLSHHGWKSTEVLQGAEMIARGDMNNAYFSTVFLPGDPEQDAIPFRVFKSTESDRVFNRDITVYSDLYFRGVL